MLFAMGILYNDEDAAEGHPSAVVHDVQVEQSSPLFAMQPGRSRRSRRSAWRELHLNLSHSDLSNDAEIARLLFSSKSCAPTIQHRDFLIPVIDHEPSLSLPQPSALESRHDFFDSIKPTSSPLNDFGSGDWIYVNTNTPHHSTPSTEPETWILVDDS